MMKLIGNINIVVKETDCFGIFSYKFDPLCISQMSYFISLYILLYKAESYICFSSLGFFKFLCLLLFQQENGSLCLCTARIFDSSELMFSGANSPHSLFLTNLLSSFHIFIFLLPSKSHAGV